MRNFIICSFERDFVKLLVLHLIPCDIPLIHLFEERRTHSDALHVRRSSQTLLFDSIARCRSLILSSWSYERPTSLQKSGHIPFVGEASVFPDSNNYENVLKNFYHTRYNRKDIRTFSPILAADNLSLAALPPRKYASFCNVNQRTNFE